MVPTVQGSAVFSSSDGRHRVSGRAAASFLLHATIDDSTALPAAAKEVLAPPVRSQHEGARLPVEFTAPVLRDLHTTEDIGGGFDNMSTVSS